MIDHLESAAEFKFADAEATSRGEFIGFASTFGNVDFGGDVVEAGAFRQTLSTKKLSSIKMYLNHDARSIPIGKWLDLQETDRGLVARGQLTLEIPKARDVHAAMKDGTLDAMSIGYRIPPGGYEMDRGGKVRRIKSVDLLEISVVSMPMNPRASITRVKADGIRTIREFEDFLRDEGGFSHAAAKSIAARGFKALDPRDEDGADIAAMLRRNIAKLT